MRTVIQRVSNASVTIDGKLASSIQNGLLILLGIEEQDDENDIEWLTGKIARLRIFNDKNQVMNLSVQDIDVQEQIIIFIVKQPSTIMAMMITIHSHIFFTKNGFF